MCDTVFACYSSSFFLQNSTYLRTRQVRTTTLLVLKLYEHQRCHKRKTRLSSRGKDSPSRGAGPPAEFAARSAGHRAAERSLTRTARRLPWPRGPGRWAWRAHSWRSRASWRATWPRAAPCAARSRHVRLEGPRWRRGPPEAWQEEAGGARRQDAVARGRLEGPQRGEVRGDDSRFGPNWRNVFSDVFQII